MMKHPKNFTVTTVYQTENILYWIFSQKIYGNSSGDSSFYEFDCLLFSVMGYLSLSLSLSICLQIFSILGMQNLSCYVSFVTATLLRLLGDMFYLICHTFFVSGLGLTYVYMLVSLWISLWRETTPLLFLIEYSLSKNCWLLGFVAGKECWIFNQCVTWHTWK